MARRRSKRDEGLLEVALRENWKASAFIAGASLILTFVLPPLLFRGTLLAGLASAFRPLGLPVATVFGAIAAVKFFAQAKRSAIGNVAPLPGGQRVEPHAPGLPSAEFGFRQAPSIEFGHPSVTTKPTTWSIEVLRSIEWKRFEELVAAYFREKGARCETIRCGADGGVDARVYGADNQLAIVQCKAWNTRLVGVKPVRELLGVMAHEKVAKGFFMATGDYTDEAQRFAETNPITLVTGESFLGSVNRMPMEAQQRLLVVATEGDYTTPTCPSCGIKMVVRNSERGDFWGCRNYPRCRVRFGMKPEVD